MSDAARTRLGAHGAGRSRGAIIRLVLRGAFLLIAFGLILGIPLSLATSRVLTSQLYGLIPMIPSFSRQPYSYLDYCADCHAGSRFAGERCLTIASAAHRISLVAFCRLPA